MERELLLSQILDLKEDIVGLMGTCDKAVYDDIAALSQKLDYLIVQVMKLDVEKDNYQYKKNKSKN